MRLRRTSCVATVARILSMHYLRGHHSSTLLNFVYETVIAHCSLITEIIRFTVVTVSRSLPKGGVAARDAARLTPRLAQGMERQPSNFWNAADSRGCRQNDELCLPGLYNYVGFLLCLFWLLIVYSNWFRLVCLQYHPNWWRFFVTFLIEGETYPKPCDWKNIRRVRKKVGQSQKAKKFTRFPKIAKT